jgi:hypothetical protein
MEPGEHEIRSKETAKLLVYVNKQLGKKTPTEIRQAATNMYGNPSILNDMVVELCATLNSLDDTGRDSIVYNAKDNTARKLADWWEEHEEADRKRIAKEKKEEQKNSLAELAKSKLTKEEFAALKQSIMK